ncbi:DUF6716 putative glycosyltransferase [Nonomuraea sp. NPDC050556]|uniref:DUF6716 putative glycosyltransferase n=1 Tax=Nonomuraea sp. NPDC050556 TaxID=3364369 RepID=UPI0037A4D2B3
MKVLAVADSDSYLKWAACLLDDLPEGCVSDLAVVRTPITPSPGQIRAAVGDRPLPPVVSARVLRRTAERTAPDVILVACTGPVVDVLVADVLDGLRPRPVFVTGLPGISVPATEKAWLFRSGCDVFVVHSGREVAEFGRIAAELGGGGAIGLARLPFLHHVARPQLPSTSGGEPRNHNPQPPSTTGDEAKERTTSAASAIRDQAVFAVGDEASEGSAQAVAATRADVVREREAVASAIRAEALGEGERVLSAGRADVVGEREPVVSATWAEAPRVSERGVFATQAEGLARRVVFATQAKVPRGREERERILLALAKLADERPELDVVVKLRAREDERQTHNERHHYERLWREMGAPGRLLFEAGPMQEQLADAAGFVTVSSTAALEAIAAGVPSLVLADFGVSAEMINLVFEGSGLLGTLDELSAGEFRTPDAAWCAENYFHDSSASDWVSLLTALVIGPHSRARSLLDGQEHAGARRRARLRVEVPPNLLRAGYRTKRRLMRYIRG